MRALPQGPGTRVVGGPRCAFYYHGVVVGFASNVSGSEEYGYEGIDVLNRLPVVEHVPLSYRCTLTAAIFRTVSRGKVQTPEEPGSLKQQNIFPRLSQVLRVEGVDAVIFDDVAKKPLYMFKGVKCSSHSFNFGARNVVLENVTFVTTALLDEDEITGWVQSAA